MPILRRHYSLPFRIRKNTIALRSHSLGRAAQRRHYSERPSPDPTPNLGSPQPTPSLSQRFKKLSREYGWSALGVYATLSILDFPFCFLAIRLIGAEHVGRWEQAVTSTIVNILRVPFPALFKERAEEAETQSIEGPVESAEAATKQTEKASIWTQLALAYAVHKSFIFLRIPATLALTPKVVNTLRKWGWNIGKRPVRKKPSTT